MAVGTPAQCPSDPQGSDSTERSGWLGTQRHSQWDGPDAMLLLSQTSAGASGWIRSLPNDPRAPTSVFLSKAQGLGISCSQNGRHDSSLSLRWPCPHVCDSQQVNSQKCDLFCFLNEDSPLIYLQWFTEMCCAIFKPWEFAWILIYVPNCTYWTTLFNCFTPVYLPRNVIIIYKILLKNMIETAKYFTLKSRFKKIKRSKIDKGKENNSVVGHIPHL